MTTWPVELPEAVCCGDVGEPAGTSDAGGGAKLPEREDEVLELLHRLDTAFRDSESIECAPQGVYGAVVAEPARLSGPAA